MQSIDGTTVPRKVGKHAEVNTATIPFPSVSIKPTSSPVVVVVAAVVAVVAVVVLILIFLVCFCSLKPTMVSHEEMTQHCTTASRPSICWVIHLRDLHLDKMATRGKI